VVHVRREKVHCSSGCVGVQRDWVGGSLGRLAWSEWRLSARLGFSCGGVLVHYDGQGRRITRTAGETATHYFFNENWQVVETRVGADPDPLDQYVWDIRYVDAPVVRFHNGNTDEDYDDPEDNTLYYTQDANWNVTALVDASTGNVVERYMYEPYGEATVLDEDWDPVQNNESAVANERLFTGSALDSETGLYSSRVRDTYHPTLGRWLERDPAGYVEGMNLYQYVSSNPANLTDPMGLCPDNSIAPLPGQDMTITGPGAAGNLDLTGTGGYTVSTGAGTTGAGGASAIADGGILETVAGIYRQYLEAHSMIPGIGGPFQVQLYLWNVGADISADMKRGLDFFNAADQAYGRNTPSINLGYLVAESWGSATITSGVNFGQPISTEEKVMRNVLFFGSEALAIGGGALALRAPVSAAGATRTATIGETVEGVAQRAFDYAVDNPRVSGLSRIQLGKDAEIQATRWLRSWAKHNDVPLGPGGLRFQVRGPHSVPDVVFDPTKQIFDFKLSPASVRSVQTQNITNDFPGYDLRYIYGPDLWR